MKTPATHPFPAPLPPTKKNYTIELRGQNQFGKLSSGWKKTHGRSLLHPILLFYYCPVNAEPRVQASFSERTETINRKACGNGEQAPLCGRTGDAGCVVLQTRVATLSSTLRSEFVFKGYGLKISLWSNDIPLDAVLKRGVFKSEGEKRTTVKTVLVTVAW